MQFECYVVDVVNIGSHGQGHGMHDLMSQDISSRCQDAVWNREYDAVGMGPPCNTFSRARNNRPGPPVLRTHEHLYGVPGLNAKDKAKVQEGNHHSRNPRG